MKNRQECLTARLVLPISGTKVGDAAAKLQKYAETFNCSKLGDVPKFWKIMGDLAAKNPRIEDGEPDQKRPKRTTRIEDEDDADAFWNTAEHTADVAMEHPEGLSG